MANEAALFAHQRRFCKNARRGIREALADARLYWRSKVLKRPRSPALGMSGHAPIPPVNEDCGEPLALQKQPTGLRQSVSLTKRYSNNRGLSAAGREDAVFLPQYTGNHPPQTVRSLPYPQQPWM
ncbi:hypothetical protein BKA70DRAFT_1244416 [Coprinopsis sp. MPI-PUGE-AT-0042]|nr:hypothetical protein BKA70DRAFT_1244416 [Coprinopsis sp. MPI-PUGE-AT-0042]